MPFGWHGRTHSCRQLIQTGGDVIAVTHPVPKTGYKAPNAYGARPVLQGETCGTEMLHACAQSATASLLNAGVGY